MKRFLFRALRFHVFFALSVALFALHLPYRLMAGANTLVGMVNIELLLLLLDAAVADAASRAPVAAAVTVAAAGCAHGG
jgi:hypothetical protein